MACVARGGAPARGAWRVSVLALLAQRACGAVRSAPQPVRLDSARLVSSHDLCAPVKAMAELAHVPHVKLVEDERCESPFDEEMGTASANLNDSERVLDGTLAQVCSASGAGHLV